jgi:hypothetical protein
MTCRQVLGLLLLMGRTSSAMDVIQRIAAALAKRAAFSATGALAHAFTACSSATPSTAMTTPYSASATAADAAPNRPADLAVPDRPSGAGNALPATVRAVESLVGLRAMR